MEYRIVYGDELYHHGVKGMKWGVRRQMQTSINSRRQRQMQMSPEERQAQRKRRVKRAAAVGATIAVAGLAAYGGHKYKNLKNEMNTMNSRIKLGQALVDNLYKDNASFTNKHNPALSSSVSYLGNDFKFHTATKTANSYENLSVGTQRTFNTVRDYARAKKRYTGRY